jgi:flagellar M-ring protein FliF
LLAQAAVGFDAARGDLLTVQDLAFDDNRTAVEVSPLARMLKEVESSPELIKYAALLAGMLVLVAFGVRPALQRVGAAPVAKSTPKELAAGAAAAKQALSPPEPASDAERARAQEIFEQVAEHLKREPAQSSRLLQSWIHSE